MVRSIRRVTAVRSHDRLQLTRLDACLAVLEEANLHDEVVVPPGLVSRLRAHVPALRPGMQTREAIALVLREQQQYLCDDAGNGHSGGPHDGPERLDRNDAQLLTQKIRSAANEVCMLLLEAYERKAARALGYPSWEAYVEREFGFSRSRSYEFLDQGRVIRSIVAEVAMSGMPDISTRAALEIKAHLAEVIDEARVRARDVAETDVPRVVEAVVREIRARTRPARCSQGVAAKAASRPRAELAREIESRAGEALGGSSGVTGRPDYSRLVAAISLLASLPPAADVIAQIPRDDQDGLDDLNNAISWLLDFGKHLMRIA